MERIEMETRVGHSFRVQHACDTFGLAHTGLVRQSVCGELPGEKEAWEIGVIVGPSGSGKSTFARAVIGAQGKIQGAVVHGFDWPEDRAVVDGFAGELSAQEVTGALTQAGLGSVRDWLKPWHVLSGGQRARADLARAMMLDAMCIGMDEFTGTLDRETAKLVAIACAKGVRAGRTKVKRFVAITCMEDVVEWLEPDWVLRMPTGRLTRGRLCRPGLGIEVRSCSSRLWSGFAKHHYLSHSLSPVARCYAACHAGESVGFCATMPAPGKDKTRRLVHRLVVLPQWQGLGVGRALLGTVADIETGDGPLSLVTSHPGLARALKGDRRWRAAKRASESRAQAGLMRRFGRAITPHMRLTLSFYTDAGLRGCRGGAFDDGPCARVVGWRVVGCP
jgi:energy-coupling factor transporter ATP-binding protein EcfA2